MRSNSARLLQILDNDNLGTFHLVRLSWNSEYFYTSHPHDLTYNGNTYVSESNLVSIEQPRYVNVVDRSLYKIMLDGIDPTMRAEVDAGILHRDITVLIGFTVNDVPQLGLQDTITAYKGRVADYELSIDDGTMGLEITGSAPLSNLDAISTLFTTGDAMRNLDPTDTSFDQVAIGSAEVQLKWGKK